MDKHSAMMERVSTLGMAGLFAAAMLILSYAQLFGHGGFRGPLAVIAPWIHPLIFAGGLVLAILLVFQMLWGGGVSLAHHHHDHDHHEHHHEHDHNCDHDHGHAENDPKDQHKGKHDEFSGTQSGAPQAAKPSGGSPAAASKPCDHEHEGHQHHHHHGHEHHGHDHHGHDHGWSPIRYVPLVIPLLLCAMGLPSSEMINAFQQDLINDSTSGVTLVAAAAPGDPLRQLSSISLVAGPLGDAAGLALALGTVADLLDEDPNAPPVKTDLADLERIAANPIQREAWSRQRSVEVEGMFSPGHPLDNGMTFFSVVQMRVACCMGDALPAVMFAASRKEPDLRPMEWVAVRGRLDFIQTEKGFRPAMRVFRYERREMPARPFLTK